LVIRVGEFRIGTEEKEVINEILESGRISEGERVREFEKLFSEYVGTKCTVAVNSGTSALIAGLEAVKNKFGFEAKTSLEEGLAKTIAWYKNERTKVKRA
jgi:dTDP-4-amino-4,6-dideoxygalactose transaminase